MASGDGGSDRSRGRRSGRGGRAGSEHAGPRRGGHDTRGRDAAGSRGSRAGEQRAARSPERRPELPEGAYTSELDAAVRRELATLPKGLAELVGCHLVAVGLTVDEDPDHALEHARFARSRASRVAAVREAVGLAAYHAGEWSEALAELRAARRLSGRPLHLAVLADCERALRRPERALEIARSAEAATLDVAETVELRIVAAAARRDLAQLDAAVVALQGPELDSTSGEPWVARLRYAYADNLLAAGRTGDALRWFRSAADADIDGETDAAQRAAQLAGQVADQ